MFKRPIEIVFDNLFITCRIVISLFLKHNEMFGAAVMRPWHDLQTQNQKKNIGRNHTHLKLQPSYNLMMLRHLLESRNYD